MWCLNARKSKESCPLCLYGGRYRNQKRNTILTTKAEYHFVHNIRMILALGGKELSADDLLDDISAHMTVTEIFHLDILSQPIYYRRI